MKAVSVWWFDGTDLDAMAFSIADNRSHEFAEWDEPELAKLLQQLKAEDSLDGVGYSTEDLDALVQQLREQEEGRQRAHRRRRRAPARRCRVEAGRPLVPRRPPPALRRLDRTMSMKRHVPAGGRESPPQTVDADRCAIASARATGTAPNAPFPASEPAPPKAHMANRTPQTQEKRRREQDKQRERQEKFAKRQERNAAKRDAKNAPPVAPPPTMSAAEIDAAYEASREAASKPAPRKP